MVNPTANISLPSSRKVSKLLEIVKAENRTECFSNHTVCQSLRICNDKLHIKTGFLRALPPSPWPATATTQWKRATYDSCLPQQATTVARCSRNRSHVARDKWDRGQLPQSSERNHTPPHTHVSPHKNTRVLLYAIVHAIRKNRNRHFLWWNTQNKV